MNRDELFENFDIIFSSIYGLAMRDDQADQMTLDVLMMRNLRHNTFDSTAEERLPVWNVYVIIWSVTAKN